MSDPADVDYPDHKNIDLIAENKELRILLATRNGTAHLYTDDGELQDNSKHPLIDYKRDSAANIKRKLCERGALEMEALGLGEVERAGQVKAGYTLQISSDTVDLYKVDQVIDPGTDTEEVILNSDLNLYFITSKLLDGSSWVKSAYIIHVS